MVFAPRHANCIGSFDVATETFSRFHISSTMTANGKNGAILGVSDGLMIMAPFKADQITMYATAAPPPPASLRCRRCHRP